MLLCVYAAQLPSRVALLPAWRPTGSPALRQVCLWHCSLDCMLSAACAGPRSHKLSLASHVSPMPGSGEPAAAWQAFGPIHTEGYSMLCDLSGRVKIEDSRKQCGECAALHHASR